MESYITVNDILAARDRRCAAQKRLCAQYSLPLVSFTMNIPGPIKQSPLIRLAFEAGLAELKKQLGDPVADKIITPDTGCEALLVYRADAQHLKEVCMAIESTNAASRLYDLDVLTVSGEKLSRPVPRTCLVCGGDVMVCSRNRAHGLDAVTAACDRLLREFAAEHLSRLAYDALITEAELTPKPGLVDRRNNGAHRDMDLSLFYRSAAALLPHFRHMVDLGLAMVPTAELQQAGTIAEADMLSATDGVNTHKGAFFSFALLLAAWGQCLVSGGNVWETAARLAGQLIPPQHTHGAKVRERYAVGGPRTEAICGFPTVCAAAARLADHDPLSTLLWLMSWVEDSNVYYRGGSDGAAFVQQSAVEILAAPPAQRIPLTKAMDDACIRRNLSPGGCADLLALALFVRNSGLL